MQLLGYRDGNNLLAVTLELTIPTHSVQLHIFLKWITSAPLWTSYLQEPKLVQETTQVSDDLRPCNKFLPHRVIQNQIQVALTEASFLLGKKNVQLEVRFNKYPFRSHKSALFFCFIVIKWDRNEHAINAWALKALVSISERETRELQYRILPCPWDRSGDAAAYVDMGTAGSSQWE